YLDQRKPRIEIIPMIDIMLFLLVFFVMIALKMVPTSGHVTKLPTSSTVVQTPAPKVTVEVEANGNIYVEGKNLTAGQLTELLKGREAAASAVTIDGAESVSLQSVMIVVDAIKNGGATQISLAAHNKAVR
ncbi:MAG: biopolymer transporter ExbD, partial [Verrucomicrobiota bacterium]